MIKGLIGSSLILIGAALAISGASMLQAPFAWLGI